MIKFTAKLQDTGKNRYLNIPRPILMDLDIAKGDTVTFEYKNEGVWELRKNGR